ncbi:DUF4012 domain-containing protein [Candidatus Uhrbacteria bacterium]|nr:DUF4012 domain-containing protein [Candidatus Uhrbacteria bacterium]MBT7716837.1 DUF4012 domain-containing protein [Candidatus Uhrbacteria bacterium]
MKKHQPKVSMLYDDALPVSLKQRGISESVSPGIRLGTSESAPVSPYIIELSRKDQKVAAQDTKQERIAQLARELAQVNDFDQIESADSTAPVNALELSVDELRDQLREPERIIKKVRVESSVKSVTQIEALPELEVDTADVWSVIEEEIVQDVIITNDEDVLLKIESEVDHDSKKVISSETLVERFSRIHLLLPKAARHRAMAAFLVVSFILVMPLHAMQGIIDSTSVESEITRISSKAITEIESAASSAQAQEFATASLDFERAAESFESAQESLQNMHLAATALVNIIPQTDNTYETVQGLVSAGASLSKAAALISTAIEELSEADSYSLSTKLELLTTYMNNALPQVVAANKALQKVDLEYIPAEYQDKITLLLQTAPSLETSINEFLQFSGTLQIIIGGEQKMRYLLAFQNNTELRATGGFIGSFAQVDMLGGQMSEIDIPEGGTYDMQGQLDEYIAPPEPLTLLNSRWELQDANWFPDFPSSAQKMLGFYESAGGPTLDGVIAFNATLIPQLLAITGPIEMPEYDRTITSENFLFETQKIVEYEYTQYEQNTEREEDAPKQFIGDLAPKLLERLSTASPEELLQVLDLLSSSLSQKDMMIFMTDNELQSDIETLGWSGSLKQTDGDYLMVVNTNLGGGKTDTVIKQDIEVDVEIAENGSITNTVTITKEHMGLSSALFEGANNVDYIRLYVPQGSELLSASGFEIPDSDLFKTSDIELEADEDMLLWTSDFALDLNSGTDIWTEQGKTVFGNWIQTKPGEIETITFTYQLPFTFEQTSETILEMAKAYLGLKQLNEYSLLLQKQPGVETRQTSVNIFGPSNHNLLWSSQNELTTSGAKVNNQQDYFFSTLFEAR